MTKLQVMNNIFTLGNEICGPTEKSPDKGYAIFYPTDGYYLTKVQHDVYTSCLAEMNLLGDTVNIDIEFITLADDAKMLELKPIPNFDYSIYKKNLLLFENCIIDSEFRWSVCIYQDHLGIIYGPKSLLGILSAKYDLKRDVEMLYGEIVREIKNSAIKEKYRGFLSASFGNSSVR